ncbi:MAG TPA: S46 family peptidase [Longimicrobiales bacterium]|nr:S46 family peptidase [Longimicrobiales bacterium]
MNKRILLLLIAPLLAGAVPAAAQVSTDTIRAGRFDYGKMWTFEYAPERYFTETYGFEANQAWFDRARMAALRVPGCSASFVSPDGLVVTNHHCIRGRVASLSRPGENLLDNGFYARTLEEERPIPGYYVDQLIGAEDVSDEVFAALDRATDEASRRDARSAAAQAIQARIRARHPGETGITVQVVPLYNGGRYSAYTFRRHTDVRLVAAAELQLGFFGGDPDNFTYPRYALDFGFLRVYGAEGRPLRTDHYFNWSEQGVEENDVVFVIGNPGATSRLLTIPQLEYRREVFLPAVEPAWKSRIDALWDFVREDRHVADSLDVRNRAFGLSNTWKQYVGQLDALYDPAIMARKADAERQFRDSVNAKPALRERYGNVLERIAALQPQNRELDRYLGAFSLWGGVHEAAVLRRAILAQQLEAAQRRNASADTVAALRTQLRDVADLPRGLERRLLVARLQDFVRALPADHPVRRAALGDATPEAAAERWLGQSVFATATGTASALDQSSLPGADIALATVLAAAPVIAEAQQRQQQTALLEADLAQQLGRARFEIYGTAVPPDGSGSPRITDGVVRSYEYNGTIAPPYTTFYGMYDRFHAFGPDTDWDLPERWRTPPAALDLGTPLNFISTADTYGGNSGSPAVTKDLEIVGLNFDRNINGLSRNFIYLPERGRNIMVDVRAIREALDDVYDADRIVMELTTHRVYATEAEADAARP